MCFWEQYVYSAPGQCQRCPCYHAETLRVSTCQEVNERWLIEHQVCSSRGISNPIRTIAAESPCPGCTGARPLRKVQRLSDEEIDQARHEYETNRASNVEILRNTTRPEDLDVFIRRHAFRFDELTRHPAFLRPNNFEFESTGDEAYFIDLYDHALDLIANELGDTFKVWQVAYKATKP